MPAKKVRINVKSIAALQRGQFITDDVVPGFKARRPNKHVLYGLNIRIAGRMRWISLGSEKDLTPSQARAEAERIRGLKRDGVNVAAERDRKKATITAEVAAARFMAEHVKPKLRPSTAAHYHETLERLVLPHLGHFRLDELTLATLAHWHGLLSDTPVQANRAAAILSSMLSWATKLRLLDVNPSLGLQHFRERAVNRYPTATRARPRTGDERTFR